MADIRPFHGIRYTKKAGEIQQLVCPPYDIISETERQAFLAENPYNMIRLELPIGDRPYREAGETLAEWIQNGLLHRDMDEGLYIYELEFFDQVEKGEKKRLKGLICLVHLEAFENNVVLPHEETLSKAKKDRFQLLEATKTNFSQIYSLYPDPKHLTRQRMDQLTEKQTPRYEFSDGLVTHRMWVVNDPVAIEAFRDDFVDRKLYIADGHHRYETALNYQRHCRQEMLYTPGADCVMMFLADMEDPGLVVFPTHRLVSGLADFDPAQLLDRCRAYFSAETLKTPQEMAQRLDRERQSGNHAFGFYAGTDFHLLTLSDPAVMKSLLPHAGADVRTLDVSILHKLILESLLGIDGENLANQKNLSYTRDMGRAVADVQEGRCQCAFFLNPTGVSEIAAVAANGEKMPQKSTYFYPKLTTGLVIRTMGGPDETN